MPGPKSNPQGKKLTRAIAGTRLASLFHRKAQPSDKTGNSLGTVTEITSTGLVKVAPARGGFLTQKGLKVARSAGSIQAGDTVQVQQTGSGLLVSAFGEVPIAEAAYEFFPPADVVSGTGAASVGSANQVRVLRFSPAKTFTVEALIYQITTAGAGGDKVSFGVYNENRSNKIIDTGALDASGLVPPAAAVLATPGLLSAELFYWFAWTATATGIAVSALTLDALWRSFINIYVVQLGTAANASVAGVLPASLGAISAAAITELPYIKFQG
jgi:hypothetical protein